MSLTPKRAEAARLIEQLERELRGRYLSAAAWIETLVADCLAGYFCSNEQKRSLLFSNVLTGGGLQLSQKIRVLKAVLDKVSHPEATQHKAAIEALEKKMRPFRNRMAHCHVDTSYAAADSFDGKNISIVFYEDGELKKERINWEIMQEKLAVLQQAREHLVQIQAILKGA